MEIELETDKGVVTGFTYVAESAHIDDTLKPYS